MRNGDLQIGSPAIPYSDTQASIEALSGLSEGAVAYATDIDKLGTYDGSGWTWIDPTGGGDSYPPSWKPEPDKPPSTSNAKDDEFNDGSFDTVLWTETTNGSGTHTIVEADGLLTVTMPTSDLDLALTQSAPSGDFTLTACFGFDKAHSDYQSVGLAVWEGTIGSSYFYRIAHTARDPDYGSALDVQRFSNWAWAQNYHQRNYWDAGRVFGRFRYDSSGSVLYMGWSKDGNGYQEYRLTGIASLSNIGLFITCDGVPDYQWDAQVYWFRVTT